ncbi:ABC transporter substrate-binding protein [Diaminobutyricibacter sp. McL0608]|uniref:ABC transporter substrate-binding protein n=1 Tax=Leifsonia sp. McL0608 TaxID=3143537 RepID=UPI0031F3179B
MKLSNPEHPMRSRSARRRIVVVLAAAASVSLALAGCSGNAGSDKVTLSYAIWDAPQKPAMQKIVDEFEKQNPNIQVKIQVTPWDTYWTKLQTAATGGSAPDVFWMNDANLPNYANGGAIASLQNRIDADKMDMSNYVQAQVKADSWDGKVFGIPKDVDAIGLWYNKKLFADAGVPVPTADWTQQDLITAAKKLTDPAKGVYGIAAQDAAQQSYYSTIPQAGGYVISPDKKKSGYDTPEAIAGVQFWVDLINKYKVSPTLQQMTDTDPDTMFQSGKVAMIYEGSWAATQFNGVPYAKANAQVAPMPKGSQAGGVTNGLANVMSAKTAHPDQAWAFLKFLGSKRAADIQAETGTVIPAYNGTAEVWAKSLPNYNLSVFVDALKTATAYPASLNTAVWQDAATKEFDKAWTGDESVETAAKNVTAMMNTALAAEQK